ncbi:hypothetical protein N7475_003611 [Penicillium sp. IBT 31633x]|nr:hypothetical protein N7475_003611 [Penicillium sp. IBT 31633x]
MTMSRRNCCLRRQAQRFHTAAEVSRWAVGMSFNFQVPMMYKTKEVNERTDHYPAALDNQIFGMAKLYRFYTVI